MSRCYLYVLPLAYEDILKLGISSDPLARATAFSRRYYEFFDLSRSVLVEFDSRAEARSRESGLHRQLREWNAMQPITVPRAAAGKREWYRGAYDTVLACLQDDHAAGRVIHHPALPWWQQRLRERRELLHEWTAAMRHDARAEPAGPHLQQLTDVLDAYACLGVSLRGVTGK
jgi:hypothetical protein